MIVYRDCRRELNCGQLLGRVLDAMREAEHAGHDHIVEALIAFGEMEAGIVDQVCAERDLEDALTRRLRQLAIELGRTFRGSWWNRAGERFSTAPLLRAVESLSLAGLPAKIVCSAPEGYAYYGLYPETYLAAAELFYKDMRPDCAAVIGIRSIGTSLSAAVGGTLTELGVPIWSFTVRPRGHPFARRLLLAPELEAQIASRRQWWFLVVDEGPGLSGSSFAAVAEMLSWAGVPDERIILFPSWIPEADVLVSRQARRRWLRHRKYSVDFERAVLPRLEMNGAVVEDLSAGKWRRLHYSDPVQYPPAHPQHERRKYLIESRAGERYMAKFAGLGSYGRTRLMRAQRLAGLGWGPKPAALSSGFLFTPFENGRALAAGDASPELLERLALYLACRAALFPAVNEEWNDQISQMARNNIAETFGAEFKLCWEPAERAPLHAIIDGRMLPHEWLQTSSGYVKADSVDHGDDHFFPGPGDVAWDVAATCLEFALRREERRFLIARYQHASGDLSIEARLRFHCVCYLSFRLGYSALASHSLAGADEGRRFAALHARYRDQLIDLLQQNE